MWVSGKRTRFAAAVLAALVTGATGCTGEWPVPAGADGSVAWEPCPGLLDELLGDIAPPQLIDRLRGRATYDCDTVPVPRDWSAPEAPETFEISLVRARSTAQRDRIGSLFVNPGGPGASGVEAAVVLSFGPLFGGLPDEVTDRFDVVGFDPRGVGRSSPVECFSDAALDEGFAAEPDPVGRDAFDAAVAHERRKAEACGAKYDDTLRYYSTEQTAHDLEALRAAVGDDRLTYLGFSYGTLLGAVYAQLYPQRIRALVLDGAVDPEQDGVAATEQQAQGFERALDNFAAWCADTPDQCPLGRDARTAIADAIADARRTPLPGEGPRDATAGWVFWSVVATLYARERWPQLGTAIDQLQGGDPDGVLGLADVYAQRGPDGSYPNVFEANHAVNCADGDADLTVAQVRDLQRQWREQYPMFGGPLAMSMLGCALWPGEDDPYPTGPAQGAPPILVVGTRGDPATPYESTGRLADMLGSGVVLTWEGEGHTAYPGTPCINRAVGRYLVDLAVPEEGTSCPPE